MSEPFLEFVVDMVLPSLILAVTLGIVVYISVYLALRNFFGGKSWEEVRE